GPKALGVMVEAAIGLHQLVQRALTGVAERSVAEIVRERDRLRQFRVQSQRTRDGAGNMRGLDRMRQSGAVVITLVIDEDLGFVFEPAEGGGMNDPVAIALKDGAHRMLSLGKFPPAAPGREHRVWREYPRLNFLQRLSVTKHRDDPSKK